MQIMTDETIPLYHINYKHLFGWHFDVEKTYRLPIDKHLDSFWNHVRKYFFVVENLSDQGLEIKKK